MASLDEIFYLEFNNSMAVRRANSTLCINELPLTQKLLNFIIPKKNEAVIRGITEQYYSSLNYATSKQLVVLVGRKQLSKKIYLPDGRPRLDDNNKQKTEDIHVPNGCASVVSTTKISVPRVFQPREQFSYVDFIKKNDSIKYIYILPKKYMYLVNMCALVISVNKLKSYYTGIRVTLVNGHNVYIHVIPFKPTYSSETKPYRIIYTKASANFDIEILELLALWESNNIIFNREITKLQEPIKGIVNCGIFHFSSTMESYELFNSEKSLEGDEEEY